MSHVHARLYSKMQNPLRFVWSSCETCSPALTNMKKSYSVCPAVFWALCEFKYSGNQIVIRSHPDLYNKSILVYHTKTWRSETRVHFTSKIKWWWNVALDTSQKLFIWICRRLTFTWANWTSACFHWPAGEYLFIFLKNVRFLFPHCELVWASCKDDFICKGRVQSGNWIVSISEPFKPVLTKWGLINRKYCLFPGRLVQ